MSGLRAEDKNGISSVGDIVDRNGADGLRRIDTKVEVENSITVDPGLRGASSDIQGISFGHNTAINDSSVGEDGIIASKNTNAIDGSVGKGARQRIFQISLSREEERSSAGRELKKR